MGRSRGKPAAGAVLEHLEVTKTKNFIKSLLCLVGNKLSFLQVRQDTQDSSAGSFHPVIKSGECGPTTTGRLPEPPVLGGKSVSGEVVAGRKP